VIFVKSLVYNILIYLGIIICCLIGIPLLILPSFFLRRLSALLGWYFIFITKNVLNTTVNIFGLENLNRADKFFIASAHQSMFETFVYNYIVPNGFFILKKELMSIPIFNLFLKKLNCVPINRGKITKKNLNFSDHIFKNISEGKILIIFPQGTRVPCNEKYPLKKGVTRIYKNLKIGCLPVKLNTGNFWPKNSFIKYPGEINFVFREFIEPNLSKEKFLEKLENSIYN